MSRTMGLLLKEWRMAKGWSREQLVSEMFQNYPHLFDSSDGKNQLLSEKTIQRGESGQSNPTIRTLSLWIGTLQGIPAEQLDTFLSELFSSLFSGDSVVPLSLEGLKEKEGNTEWNESQWKNLLSFISTLQDIPEEVEAFFLEKHHRKSSLFFNRLASKKLLNEKKQEPKGTIFLLDDEVDILTTLSDLLANQYEVLIESDAEKALKMFETDPMSSRIGVIISDQRMPMMSGVSFLHRSLDFLPHAQRIIVTGYSDVDAIIDSINLAKVYQFVLKPFDPHDLLLIVEQAFERFDLERKQRQLYKQIEKSKSFYGVKDLFALHILEDVASSASAMAATVRKVLQTTPSLFETTELPKVMKEEKRLLALLDAVGEWAQKGVGGSVLEELHLVPFLEETIQLFREEMKQKEIQYQFHVDKQFIVLFDRKALSIILYHLFFYVLQKAQKGSVLQVDFCEDQFFYMRTCRQGEVLSTTSVGCSDQPHDTFTKEKVGERLYLCKLFIKSYGGNLAFVGSDDSALCWTFCLE